jgi:uncharacterized membrane protein YbaN (DUF454 family)
LTKGLYIFLASLFLVLGLTGVFVPGLPTTPFLLLSSYFAARSSPRFHNFLLSSKLVGPILRDWDQHRGVRLRAKWQATFLVFIAIGLVYLSSLHAVGQGIVAALAAIGLFVIWRLPTIE